MQIHSQSLLGLLAVLAGTAPLNAVAQAPEAGPYWAVYNMTTAPADASCLVTEGDAVPDECCLGAGTFTPHSSLKADDVSCFSLGPGLIPFSGCVGDGVAGYGENCDGAGMELPFAAADASECGCGFVIEGSGCYKANDLPDQQWFVYLDGAQCEIPSAPEEGPYWAVYDMTTAPADSACLVTEGDAVPDECCLGAGTFTPHSDLKADDVSCFSLGPGLIPFSGCVGDGVAGYGENCDGAGMELPFAASDASECGCGFVIEGSGCYKANDLPDQQWFVYLDGDQCAAPPVAPEEGPYWAVYDMTTAPADSACLVTEGDAVPDECCLGAGTFTPHSDLKADDVSCFSLGPGLIPFSGCVGDGVAGYGENCDGAGMELPFAASDASECGCGFVIEGSGCYKANDLPDQQWFVYLDGDQCAPPPVAPEDGPYWAVYDIETASADSACLVTEGDAVPDECCLGAGSFTPHSALKADDVSCFSLGPGLIPFSGCVGDGVAGYGENCDGAGMELPFAAADASACGCGFVIEGSGCYKANDLPGEQWFVYLDGDDCTAPPAVDSESEDEAPATTAPTAAPTSGSTNTLASISAIIFVLVSALL